MLKRKDAVRGTVCQEEMLMLKHLREGLRTEEERCDMKGRNLEEEICVKRKCLF